MRNPPDHAILRLRKRRAKLFKRMNAAYKVVLDDKFVEWDRRMGAIRETASDPFVALLRERYRKDYEAGVAKAGALVLNALVRVLQAHQVRVFSLGAQDLYLFEDKHLAAQRNRIEGHPKGWHRWPEAWAVARALDIAAGCGNSSQAQVKLSWWKPDLFGTYDIRAKHPVQIDIPFKLFDPKSDCHIKGEFGFDDIEAHLARCRNSESARTLIRFPNR